MTLWKKSYAPPVYSMECTFVVGQNSRWMNQMKYQKLHMMVKQIAKQKWGFRQITFHHEYKMDKNLY